MRTWGPLATVMALGAVGCQPELAAPGLRDLQGQVHTPTAPVGDAVHVLIFTSHECPIANGYAPTLKTLEARWSTEPRVQLFLVHVEPDLTAAAARDHARDYALAGTILLDPTHAAAQACGVTKTPEAVVMTAKGQLYRGRIDDQWRKLGSRAPAASSHDLADAVTCALQDERIPEPHPQAVGCLLPEPR